MVKRFIETERTFIKELEPSDFPLLRLQRKDEAMTQFSGGPTEDSKIEYLNNLLYQHLLDYGFSAGLIFNKETNECMGRAGLVYVDFKGPPDVEGALFLYRPFWVKGYAIEISTALREYAFHVLGKERVFSTIDPKNIAVRRMIKKVGMTFLREEYYSTLEKNVHVYVKYR